MPAYELTGDDVVYSLRKASNKGTSAYASDYAGMTFGSPDPYSVTATLDRPLSTALFYPRVANYSGGYILCKRAAEKLGRDGLKTHPVGTGPFMFKSYRPNEKMDLVANDAYVRGTPQLDGVEYRYMADLSSRELGLRSGQLDVIYGQQDGKWVDQLSRAPNVKVDVVGVGEVSTVYFNVTKAPFDNPKVRQAVASALNRDEFLALYGTKVARKVFSPVPLVGVGSVALGGVLGTLLGLAAGYSGRWIDNLVMRGVDILMAFPSLLLGLAVLAVLGVGLGKMIVAIGIVLAPSFARVVHAATLSLKEREFVEAARCLGAGRSRIIGRYILPNLMGETVVLASLLIASAIRIEASLSFIGLGVSPPTPTWGNIIRDGTPLLLSAPWLSVFPGLAMLVSILAFNLVGDGVRDVLDPRTRQ